MDADFTSATGGTTLARKAWTAYVGIVLITVVLLVFVVPLAWHYSHGAGAGLAIVILAVATFKFAEIRVYRLYYNDMGVWLHAPA